MDEIWDSWDVGLSSVSSVFWLTFKSPLRWDGDPRVTPGPSLEATSVCATNCGCQGCPVGARGSPSSAASPGVSLPSQHSQGHAEGREVRGDPTSQGDPSSPQGILFAAPTAIPGDFCGCDQRRWVWGILFCASLPIPVNNSRTEEWN